jgi:hypothetical protein
MTYEPFPRSVEDNQNDLRAWIGADGDRDDAAVALSVHHQMRHMSRTMRTAILAGFPEPVEPELVPYRDFLPPLVHEDQAGPADLGRILEGLRGL